MNRKGTPFRPECRRWPQLSRAQISTVSNDLRAVKISSNKLKTMIIAAPGQIHIRLFIIDDRYKQPTALDAIKWKWCPKQPKT